jgi:hypothetical protein
MQINFGKHAGKTSEELLLKHASYVAWVVSQTGANSQLASLQTEIEELIQTLDLKPFAGKCHTTGCKRAVTKLSAYLDNDKDLYRWCEHCDPYTSGANPGKLSEVRTYADMMRHVQFRCGGTKGGYDRIVKSYAKTKGLPGRISTATAIQFFA